METNDPWLDGYYYYPNGFNKKEYRKSYPLLSAPTPYVGNMGCNYIYELESNRLQVCRLVVFKDKNFNCNCVNNYYSKHNFDIFNQKHDYIFMGYVQASDEILMLVGEKIIRLPSKFAQEFYLI
jgi:hypothetical protein